MTNNVTDKSGTSSKELEIFYYVKRYFADAVNRLKINDQFGFDHEVDIYIPSLKIAIEYDGFFWHKQKLDQDNYKNLVLNKEGIFVIRVRDCGLPQLDKFNGMLLFHGSARKGGQHTNEIIETIIRYLGNTTNNDKLKKYRLTYNDFLQDRADFQSLLYVNERHPNFTDYPVFKYWDFKKNGNLNPKFLDNSCNAFAWFKCPEGISVIRNLQHLPSGETFLNCGEFSLRNICPLRSDGPYTHSNDCSGCSFYDVGVQKIVNNFIKNGANIDLIDDNDAYYMQRSPRACYFLIKALVDSDSTIKNNLEKLFIKTSSISDKYFFAHYIKFEKVAELDDLVKFFEIYPEISKDNIAFNVDIFDVDEKSRNILTKYFEDMLDEDEYCIEDWITENPLSPTMKKIFKKLDKDYSLYIEDYVWDEYKNNLIARQRAEERRLTK